MLLASENCLDARDMPSLLKFLAVPGVLHSALIFLAELMICSWLLKILAAPGVFLAELRVCPRR